MRQQYTIHSYLSRQQKQRVRLATKTMNITESELIKRALHYFLTDFPHNIEDLSKRKKHGRV